jgi:hypothetical protein
MLWKLRAAKVALCVAAAFLAAKIIGLGMVYEGEEEAGAQLEEEEQVKVRERGKCYSSGGSNSGCTGSDCKHCFH